MLPTAFDAATWPATLIDRSFLIVLAVVAPREIAVRLNWRKLAIALFLVGNALSYAEAVGLVSTEEASSRAAAIFAFRDRDGDDELSRDEVQGVSTGAAGTTTAPPQFS